jgi:hypothetical protein
MLSKTNPIQTFHIPLRYILILLPSKCSFPSDFQVKMYTLPISLMRAVYLAQLSFLDFIAFGEEYQLWNSFYCNIIVPPPVTYYRFDPNIFVRILFSNTLSLSPFVNVERTSVTLIQRTGKFDSFNILIFTFADKRWKDKRLCTEP